MKYNKYIKGLLVLLPLLGWWGCESDDMPGSEQGELVPVTIRLTASAPETTQTRGATAELVDADYKVESLKVYITDGSNTIPLSQDDFTFEGEGESYKGTSTETVELIKGKTYQVYAIANAEITDYATNLSVDAISMVNENNATVPMSAKTEWTIEGEGTKSIKLVRMVAQMQVSIKNEANKEIKSLTIAGLCPSQTNLYRKGYKEVEMPTDATYEDWTSSSNFTNIPNFYLHESAEKEFEIKLEVEGEAEARTGSFTRAIPRNCILPLIIQLTDGLSFGIAGTYQYAPIGVLPIVKNINPNGGYEVELPEGASNINIIVQLRSDGQEVTSGDVKWNEPSESIPYFTIEENDEGGTLSITSKAIPAIPAEGITIPLSATYNSQSCKRNLTIKARELDDSDTRTCSASTEAQPIIIEL